MARPARYPWSFWLDPARGDVVLTLGRELDEQVNIASFRQQARNRASALNLSLETRVSKDGRVITLRARNLANSEDIEALVDGQYHRVPPSGHPGLSRNELYAAVVAAATRRRLALHIEFDAADRSTLHVHAVVPGVQPLEPCPLEGPALADILPNPAELEFIRDGSSRWDDYAFQPHEVPVVLRALGWASPAQQPPDPVTRSSAAEGLAERAAREEGIERTRRNQEADRLAGALAAGAPPPWVTQ